jgi:hypothetical protein
MDKLHWRSGFVTQAYRSLVWLFQVAVQAKAQSITGNSARVSSYGCCGELLALYVRWQPADRKPPPLSEKYLRS